MQGVGFSGKIANLSFNFQSNESQEGLSIQFHFPYFIPLIRYILIKATKNKVCPIALNNEYFSRPFLYNFLPY
jgi:hypothetical protein